MKLSVPDDLDFSDLHLTHNSETGAISFDWASIRRLADYNSLDMTIFDTPDNVGGLIAAWYGAHCANGGDPDPVAEKMFNAVVAGEMAYPVIIHHGLPVEPPTPEQIRAIVERVGSQRFAADLLQLSSKNMIQQWCSGDRRPTPQNWGLYLLATGQHPDYVLTKR